MVPLVFSETNPQASKKTLKVEAIKEGICHNTLRVLLYIYLVKMAQVGSKYVNRVVIVSASVFENNAATFPLYLFSVRVWRDIEVDSQHSAGDLDPPYPNLNFKSFFELGSLFQRNIFMCKYLHKTISTYLYKYVEKDWVLWKNIAKFGFCAPEKPLYLKNEANPLIGGWNSPTLARKVFFCYTLSQNVSQDRGCHLAKEVKVAPSPTFSQGTKK